MIKLLIGGSPCTYWSIAQTQNRETTASGMGWELFKNYLIAREKFKPDFFLYENNQSAAQPIKDMIKHEFGVTDEFQMDLFTEDTGVRYIEINSALVSAQNRQRFYVHNCGNVEQPKDRGILLRDILESSQDLLQREKAYCLTATYGNAVPDDALRMRKRTMCAEPVNITDDGKSQTIKAQYAKNSANNFLREGTFGATGVAEPVGTTEDGKSFALTAYYSTGQNAPHTLTKHKGSMVAEPVKVLSEKEMDYMVRDAGKYSDRWSYLQKPSENDKALCITANISKGIPYNVVAEPVCVAQRGRMYCGQEQQFEAREDGKTNALTTVQKDNQVAEPVRIGTIENDAKNKDMDSQQYRVYSPDGKAVTQCGQGGGAGAKTGLYATPCPDRQEQQPIYEVRGGFITIKGKQYPIKLKDGFYIIRKLTVKECARLQTMPDDYCRAVSDSQAYKGLGNGWTAEVIMHILNGALANVPRDEEIVVLSMYDGIGTGRYCLDKMGFTNVTYYAYEIDKYAMQIALSNYPDIIECGDAFQLREDNWTLERKCNNESET